MHNAATLKLPTHSVLANVNGMTVTRKVSAGDEVEVVMVNGKPFLSVNGDDVITYNGELIDEAGLKINGEPAVVFREDDANQIDSDLADYYPAGFLDLAGVFDELHEAMAVPTKNYSQNILDVQTKEIWTRNKEWTREEHNKED